MGFRFWKMYKKGLVSMYKIGNGENSFGFNHSQLEEEYVKYCANFGANRSPTSGSTLS